MGNEAVRVAENIPGLNLYVSAIHAIRGDIPAAQRAAIRGLSNLVPGAGIVNISGDIASEGRKKEALE